MLLQRTLPTKNTISCKANRKTMTITGYKYGMIMWQNNKEMQMFNPKTHNSKVKKAG